ncbi:dipeptidyl aminopeptidase/acylaminoacyl peptidase [Silvibacterium bohemicum]|uniref:Dipeptidyl aminopeptidase/acylaminoacyl peptidase n=1 Tax=Silvibacterium bohemicum TaxID=1577686 RepID=A0A841JV70_9BACT|nr:S9 family peptidase [Silvibacterium bohemicum]MBB6143639.1 dipeptidyl aminopeptidase/acylaminoacyl peptidase [Silvibacterium bohemicum]
MHLIASIRRQFPVMAALAATTLLAGVPQRLSAQQTSHISLQDILSEEPITETALSPDGKTFAITRDGQIFLLPVDGGWPVRLTSTTGGKTGLSWSPDGKLIAFASRGGIWTVTVTGGQPRRLTDAPAGGGDPRQATDREPQWSPKGHWILFTSGRRGHNSQMVVSEDGSVSSLLTPGPDDAAQGKWSPDGTQIVFVERAREYFSGRLKILHFDPRSGQPEGKASVLYTAPVDRGGGWEIRGAEWSPDGRELVTVLQNSGWDHLYLIPASGGEPKQITDGAFEDADPLFSPDGKTLAFVSSRGLLEARNVWVMPAHGGEARILSKFDTPGISAQPEWSPDGRSIYFHHQSPTETADLLVADAKGESTPRYLTHTTPKNFEDAQVPERVTWKSKDGKEIAGLLFTPKAAKPGARLPAVLWIHGGPEGQDVFRADGWAQYLAQEGYVVLEPNYRGSSGYGEVFRNLNVEDSNGAEVDDVATGAQYLVDRGLADPAKLAIGGGSHGGTMTAYMVVHYPNLFAAAIELYGVVDRELFVERTNPPSSIRWMMKMGGSPTEKPEVYRRANVLLQVDKVQTPLLVMHGEDDPQVPPADSAFFVKALREHNKTVFYFTYPNELHGFAQPAHRLDAWEKQLAFLQHYLNPKFGTTSTSTEEVVFPESKEKQANAHPDVR